MNRLVLYQTNSRRSLCISMLIASLAVSPTLPVYGETVRTAFEAQQQNVIIKGQIVDKAGLPLIGVNILQKGTTHGIITDPDGNFELEVPSGATLIASYIGYVSQEFKAQQGKSLKITLIEDTQKLDEVVVVGWCGDHHNQAGQERHQNQCRNQCLCRYCQCDPGTGPADRTRFGYVEERTIYKRWNRRQ